MKRKILSFLLILTLIVSATPLTGIDFTNFFTPKAEAAESAEIYTWGDYEYIIININEVELRNYLGDDTEVVIPSEIEGMPVTSVGEFCFNGKHSVEGKYDLPHPNAENNNKITKVTVPSSVKSICCEAFSFMESLSEIVLNEGLELIDEFAFANCPKLQELNLPDSLVTFEFTAVDLTPVTELVFGSNLKSIDITNFEDFYVKRLVFNADVVTVEKISLCANTGKLDEIVCNGRLELGGSFEIAWNGYVDRIVCNGDVPYYVILKMLKNEMNAYFNESDGSVVFSEEEILLPDEYESNGFRYFINDESEAIISRYIGGESVVAVPETIDGYPVTEIGRFAFSSFCSHYYTVNYGSDKYISKDLITSITLPETIEVIREYAFAGNLKLAQINIPSKVTAIPYECFDSCKSLEYIEIPEAVNKIEGRVFYWCEKLKSISLPESVTEIGENTFRGCYALESVDMPGVEKIGEDAFCYCELLVITELPKLTELGSGAFYRCQAIERLDLSNVTKIGADAMGDCKGLKEVILNDNLEVLEYGVFQLCESLESVKLPSKLVTVGSCCFRLSGLKEVIFNEGLKTIEGWAFEGCFDLADVVLPDSLEYIWDIAFSRCDIEEINIPINLKILGYEAFSFCDKLTTVYFNATNCKVSNSTGDEAYIPEDWTTASPFYATKITNIVFGENITAISGKSEICGTFENCETLEAVTIPDSVNEIGTAAFKNCTSLEMAVIPDSVTEIADDAFDGCENLTIYCLDTSYACAYATAKGISVSTFIIEKIPNQAYTGSAIKPTLSVSLSSGKLTENTDFTVAYSNNINVGEAKVKVTGLGDYSNFVSTASFTIVTRSIKQAKVNGISAQNYTGEPLTPELTVTFNGRLLEEGKDYKLTYKNNRKIGTATVYIAGTGNFSGTNTVNFAIEKLSSTQIFVNSLRDFFNSILARFTSIFAF